MSTSRGLERYVGLGMFPLCGEAETQFVKFHNSDYRSIVQLWNCTLEKALSTGEYFIFSNCLDLLELAKKSIKSGTIVRGPVITLFRSQRIGIRPSLSLISD